jgi:hypothetical protein
MTPSSVTLKVAAVVHRSRSVMILTTEATAGTMPPRGLRAAFEVTRHGSRSQDAWDVFVDNGQIDDPDTTVSPTLRRRGRGHDGRICTATG